MDIQNKKTTIKELISLYENITTRFSDSYKKVQNLGYDDIKDCRNIIYKLWREASQTNVILFHLIDEHFEKLELWNLQNFSSDEQKKAFQEDRCQFIIEHLRENLFINVFLRFENFIRLISKSQNVTVVESINTLAKSLINTLNLNSDYKQLINLTTYSRNTIHSEGFHTKNDTTINYRERNFNFLKDKLILFYDEDFLYFLIKELDILVMAIIDSPQVKSIPLIEHTYSELNIYEE